MTQEIDTDLLNKLSLWISEKRNSIRSLSEDLPEYLVDRYRSFFPRAILEDTKVFLVDNMDTIDPPPGYQDVKNKLGSLPLEFNKISGLTLIDTLVIDKKTLDLGTFEDVVFRELVHVFQFKELGLDGFLMKYVDGWAKNGLQHETIPLEEEAERFLRLFKIIENEKETFGEAT